jgi:hypothetical protein
MEPLRGSKPTYAFNQTLMKLPCGFIGFVYSGGFSQY